jgi:DNA polymerase elongation subunit (family B)
VTELTELLYGRDPTDRLVAVEPAGPERMRLYRRPNDGPVESSLVTFYPWLVTDQPPAAAELADEISARQLSGAHPLRQLVRCANWAALGRLREHLRQQGRPWLMLGSPVEQFLLLSGRTLFKGLRFEELLRLQLDIETVGLDPTPAEGRVLLVALTTNHGLAETIGEPGDDEATLLRRLTARLRAIDPDLIEGHNIFNFDLPFLIARAARWRVRLAWGRDGSTPRLEGAAGAEGGRRLKIGPRSVPYRDCRIYGRQIIDTYHQIQRYDNAGQLERYGLKEVVRALGLTGADRTYLPGAEIAERWQREPATVRAYALDDVRDVERLAALTLPTEFYQTQIVPWSLQDVATRGPGEKIDDIMVRAYLAAGHSLPLPATPRGYPGGYAELRGVGLFQPVVKADVESLYPALMLSRGIAPASDRLGLYLPMLAELTARRLAAKRQSQTTSGAEHAYWQGIQSSFKVLINSFYGYLGYGRASFSDFDAAEQVTLQGQAIIKTVVAELEDRQARVIEVDTDGVYFVPPAAASDRTAAAALVSAISAELPTGINLAFDGYYQGMISLKLKNYLLMTEEGNLLLHGSSVRSRRDELFARHFAHQVARRHLTGTAASVRDLYLDTATALQQRRLPPAELVRVETITDKTFHSDATRRLAGAAAGASIGDRIEVYQRRDGSLARLRDYAGDEDIDYLLRRLRDMAGRFIDLYSDQATFDDQFPLVTSRTDIEQLRRRGPVRQLSLF